MRPIVVGVDGSEPSIRALLFAASLARDLPDAELVVVHVRYVGYLMAPHDVAEDEFSDLLDEDERYVRAVVSRELVKGVRTWRKYFSAPSRTGWCAKPKHPYCSFADGAFD